MKRDARIQVCETSHILTTMQAGPGPRPFDVTPRDLIEGDPIGWLAWVGLPVDGPVQAVDSQVSTVLAEVDKVVRVEAPTPWLAHFELQSSRDPELPYRLLEYHALLLRRHKIRVETLVILLRPTADSAAVSGLFESLGATGDPTIAFHYRVLRLWQRPVEELLSGSLGILPLAPLAAVEPGDLPSVIRRIDDRLARETDPDRADLLWAAMTLMLDLRYDRGSIQEILRVMRSFRDSVAYQILVEEGREEGRAAGREEGRVAEARRLVLTLGAERLGPPDAAASQTVESIVDLDRLERMIRRSFTSASWQELLAVD